jgi:RNA polymerase sigma-70 factor (ECF subfamily)
MPSEPPTGHSPEKHRSSSFAATDWNLIVTAASDSRAALDRLCRTYWRPVYLFVRASGVDRNDAEDDTQEFFADMFKQDWLKVADKERGSFRAFMRTRLRHFLSNRRRGERRLKRGGSLILMSAETEGLERELAAQPAASSDPAVLYERKWAATVLQTALTRLEDEERKASRAERFDSIRPFLIHPPSDGDYVRIGKKLDLPRGQVAVLVHRLSRRYAGLVRAEVGATLTDPSQTQEELRHLLRSALP